MALIYLYNIRILINVLPSLYLSNNVLRKFITNKYHHAESPCPWWEWEGFFHQQCSDHPVPNVVIIC